MLLSILLLQVLVIIMGFIFALKVKRSIDDLTRKHSFSAQVMQREIAELRAFYRQLTYSRISKLRRNLNADEDTEALFKYGEDRPAKIVHNTDRVGG